VKHFEKKRVTREKYRMSYLYIFEEHEGEMRKGKRRKNMEWSSLEESDEDEGEWRQRE
jgi:hypothetical protein